MKFNSAYCTDMGIRKKNNQDALLIQQAQTCQGEAALAAICDGMGGLKKGELASAVVIWALKDWFQRRMPELCLLEDPLSEILNDWAQLIQELHQYLKESSESAGIRVGTTVEVLLLLNGQYYICHVGDCRVYHLQEELRQLTRDQTFVQQEIEAGRMTEEAAEQDERRSLLLQCVGAGKAVQPEFLTGEYHPGEAFLLCCDGFRHKITCAEMEAVLKKSLRGKETSMTAKLEELTDLCKRRKETDNITSVLLYTGDCPGPLEKLSAKLPFSFKQKADLPQTEFVMAKDIVVTYAEESVDELKKTD